MDGNSLMMVLFWAPSLLVFGTFMAAGLLLLTLAVMTLVSFLLFIPTRWVRNWLRRRRARKNDAA